MGKMFIQFSTCCIKNMLQEKGDLLRELSGLRRFETANGNILSVMVK